jgi:PAS domain S-box-containing protein
MPEDSAKEVVVPDTPTSSRLKTVLAERTAELEHAWRRCRDLVENVPTMSVATRKGQDGLPIIEDCNRLFPDTLGHTRDEIIGRPLGDFYAPGSRTAPEIQPSARTEERLDGVERQLLDRYGGVLETVLHLAPVTARGGAVTGSRATYLDITEHKREERKRQEAQSRYRALVEQTLVGVCIVQDGSIVYVNPKMVEISGYSLEEQTAFLSFLDLVAEEDRQFMSQRLQRFLATNAERETHVVHIRRKDDITVPVEIQGGPVQFGGRPAVAMVALDISARIRLQNRLQQSQRLDNIGQLASGVAHSFNNALTAIYGRSEVLLEQMSRADPRRVEVEAILAVASDTAALTRRLLAFGQSRRFDPKTLDLNVVVGDTLKVAGPLIGAQTELVSSLEPLLGLVEADAAQLEQALLTLLLYARDETPQGGVMHVTTANVDVRGGAHHNLPAGAYVTLAVHDGGPGLAPDTAAHLFEPFTADHDDARGIGLATVHSIVTQMGGRIFADSRPGQGATITIYLTRTARTQPTEVTQPGTKPRGHKPAQHTVLVVEDEEQVRSAVREWLQQVGYRVLEASGSHEALELAGAYDGPIDLMLTDVVMPGMNGWRLTEELALTRKDVPVIYMSGYPSPVDPFERADGPTLLEKPFAPRTLIRAVRAAIAASEQPPSSSATTDDE